jgi:hypothetical protein
MPVTGKYLEGIVRGPNHEQFWHLQARGEENHGKASVRTDDVLAKVQTRNQPNRNPGRYHYTVLLSEVQLASLSKLELKPDPALPASASY